MPYILPMLLNDTAFPKASTKDLATQVRMINEQYRRMYPPIPYNCIKKAATPADQGTISGEAGTTQFDTLYREAVPETIAAWEQPHLSNVHNAAEPELYFEPKTLHMRIQRINRTNSNGKGGFDRIREIKAYIPAAMCDEQGVVCQAGDWFMWDGRPYAVLQQELTGYFKNTNVRLYVELTIESKKVGS